MCYIEISNSQGMTRNIYPEGSIVYGCVVKPMERMPEEYTEPSRKGCTNSLAPLPHSCAHRHTGQLAFMHVGAPKPGRTVYAPKLLGLCRAQAQWPAVHREHIRTKTGSLGAGSHMHNGMLLFQVLAFPHAWRPVRLWGSGLMVLHAISITQVGTWWHKKLAIAGLWAVTELNGKKL